MVDDVNIDPVFPGRTYERKQVKFQKDGTEYRGDFHDGEIQWYQPNPEQSVGEAEVKAVEAEAQARLAGHENQLFNDTRGYPEEQ